MNRLSGAAAAALLACSLALPATLATAGPAAADPAPAAVPAVTRVVLPAPTGPYALGRTVLPLVDRSRADPWVPSADGRELMVTPHYPAARRVMLTAGPNYSCCALNAQGWYHRPAATYLSKPTIRTIPPKRELCRPKPHIATFVAQVFTRCNRQLRPG